MMLTIDQCQEAADTWGFNCGPAALCAALRKTPDEIRPLMGNFESKHYTNPTLMYDVLKRVGANFRTIYRGDVPCDFPEVEFGLVRVQWGGTWTNAGVPMGARYRRTHWVAMREGEEKGREVFDVNAVAFGGWLPFAEWRNELMPWLAKQSVPGWDGRIWPTHVIEVMSWTKA